MTRHWPPTQEKQGARQPPWRGLSREEAAQYIGVGTSLFDAMVKDGRMPQPMTVRTDPTGTTRPRKIWDIRKLDAAFDAIYGDDEPDDNPFDD